MALTIFAGVIAVGVPLIRRVAPAGTATDVLVTIIAVLAFVGAMCAFVGAMDLMDRLFNRRPLWRESRH